MGMFLRRGPAPKLGTPLADIAEGKLIKLNESGSPVEFYVAKHDYEPELNGNGRTLMVRKDCYDEREFGRNNAFSGSSMDTWLNNSWLKLLDADIQTAVSTTKFYCIAGNGSSTMTTLQRAVFLLSAIELGKGSYNDGTALGIASMLDIAYMNGSAVSQWTRSPYKSNKTSMRYLTKVGSLKSIGVSGYYCGSRPCFTLPSDMILTDYMLA